jgi:hypothetical protein
MIKLSKVNHDDNEILVFDVRHGTEKVLLGTITPSSGDEYYTWESRWGFNRGRSPTLEIAQYYIAKCAKGMYR